MKLRRIVWSVDPFAENKELLRSALAAISSLVGNSPTEIEPVYVSDTHGVEAKVTAAQGELDKALSGFKSSGVKPLRVIAKPHLSLREKVEAIVEHGHSVSCDLIVLSTHSKKGPKRWILGSFAETMILYSDLPLLVVNPYLRQTTSLKNILFPTDFSTQSHEAYATIIALSKHLRCGVTLYYRFRSDLAPNLEDPVLASLQYKDELSARRRDAKTWADEAKSTGLQVKVVMDRTSEGPVARSIIRQAEMGSGLIAMASHSGPVSAALIGSTARAVLRESLCPVWIIHPRPKTALFTLTKDDVEDQLFKTDQDVA